VVRTEKKRRKGGVAETSRPLKDEFKIRIRLETFSLTGLPSQKGFREEVGGKNAVGTKEDRGNVAKVKIRQY